MALIQVTPDLLNGKATELRSIKDDHDQAMVRMRTLILGLNEIWKGDAVYIDKWCVVGDEDLLGVDWDTTKNKLYSIW